MSGSIHIAALQVSLAIIFSAWLVASAIERSLKRPTPTNQNRSEG
jgi:hypothetical protein